MKKILRNILVGIAITCSVVVAAFVLWASFPMKAEKLPYDSALTNKQITVVDRINEIELIKKGGTSVIGVIYYPGARVDSHAYISKLSAIAEKYDVRVIITKPFLNFAIFGVNDAKRVIREHSEINLWYIAGHSLGGAMACEFINKNDSMINGLILFGSYCASDLSKLPIKVLSIAGSRDGLSTKEKINARKANLPEKTNFYTIEGANHAQMGDYGVQKGDLVPAVTDEAVTSEFINALNGYFPKSRITVD